MTRVVVTGAAGFIGSHVVCRLADLGLDVVAVDNDPGWRHHLANAVDEERVQFVPSSGRWPYRLPTQATDGAEAVVHLAYAEPSGDGSEVRAETVDNLLPSLDLIDRLPSSVTKVIFASTSLVYGRSRTGALSETLPPQPDSAYALAKVGVEQALAEWAESTDRSALSLRFATVFGPTETVPRAVPNFVRAVLAGEQPVVAVAEDARDYVHVEDVAGAVGCALDRMMPGFAAINVGTGRRITTIGVAKLVAEAMGVDVEPEVGTPRRAPVELVLDPSSAEENLGFRASIPFSEGLETEIAWFRNRATLQC